jgi:hypothetical protein
MTAGWQGVGRLLLVTAICLFAWIGSSALPANGESCTELVADGGFEADGAWEFGATPVQPEYVTYTSHTDAQSLKLGIPEGANANSYSSARQFVTLPAGTTQATLSFWVYAVVGADAGADKMQSLLLDSQGDTLAVIWTSSSNDPAWRQLTYDVTQWRGQTVQLYFNAYNDGTGGTTGMFLDDVSLVVCPDAAQAADTVQPVPSSAIPSASPAGSAEIAAPAVETPALIFLTPGVDVEPDYSPEGIQTVPAPQEIAPGEAAAPSSETPPALVFFTPTAGAGSSAGTPNSAQGGSEAEGAVAVGEASPQITVVSLVVTPTWTPAPRPTRITAAPLATRGASASGAPPGDGPFTQWPKGWWFAVGAVFAIILAAGLFARRG